MCAHLFVCVFGCLSIIPSLAPSGTWPIYIREPVVPGSGQTKAAKLVLAASSAV